MVQKRLKTISKKITSFLVLASFFVSATNLHTFAQVASDPGASTGLNISSINPTSASTGGSVTITGTSFVPGSSVVLIDGKIGATITASSTTNITFTVPSQVKNDCFLGLPVAIPGCDQTPVLLGAGTHTIAVKTPTNISNSKTLTIVGTSTATTTPSIRITEPNVYTSYRIGKTYQGSFVSSSTPSQAAIVIEIVGSVATNSFKLGNLYPVPASGSFYFHIPSVVAFSSNATKNFPPGLYKLKLSLYNKVPCGGLTNCTPETLLASDLSDDFFGVVAETSPTETAPEHTETGADGEEIGEIPGVGEAGGENDSDEPSVIEGIATVAATCAITTLVGNAAKSALTGIVSAASGFLKTKATSEITSQIDEPEVPVRNPSIENNIYKLTQKERTLGAEPGNILSGFISNLFEEPSLDAIGFCIANEIIHYIVESTIQWINSGFEGKPVFIENAGAYFKDVADREAGNFIQEVIGESIGINVCQPFRVQLAVDTIKNHNRTYADISKCSLSTIKDNYNGFLQDWNRGGLPGWFELIKRENNIHGARYLAQEELSRRISVEQNTAKITLDWANGYRSFTYCDGPTRPDGSCYPGYEKTGTPGQMIESVINQRLGSAERRLEIADEFDELVSALVNQLVRIAVNEMLSIGKDN